MHRVSTSDFLEILFKDGLYAAIYPEVLHTRLAASDNVLFVLSRFSTPPRLSSDWSARDGPLPSA